MIEMWTKRMSLTTRSFLVIGSILILLFGVARASQTEKLSAAEVLKKYLLEKDYPEVFQDKQYHARVESILDVDIDNDGKKEMVVLFYPHYLQSASIIIYKVSPQGELTRVTEALAPGPLQKISGDYLDSHETGSAADFSLPEAQTNPENKNKVLQIAMAKFGGVVGYRSFYHVDSRKGPVSYLDMTNVELPDGVLDCSSFEFSRVQEIAAGPIREDASKNYLAAWVGNEIYVYLIAGVTTQGLLEKKLWVVKAPTGFKGFVPGQGLTYETASGKSLLTLKN